jgi:hypothetical protein
MGDLTGWLSRVVLDDAFRALAEADPDASFAGYALDDHAKDLLRRRDPRVLDLLGAAIRVEVDAAEPRGEPPALDLGTRIPFPEIAVVLRIVPQVTQLADGSLQVRYAAAIAPLPPAPVATAPAVVGLKPHVPWVHRPDSPAAQAAAADVRAAPPDRRRSKLLALVDAMKESW